jgi:hypothetical protein
MQTRHQWGPAPSGSTQHQSVCRRCGLREVTDWFLLPSGRPVELTRWLTPQDELVGSRSVDSHQPPPRQRALEILDRVGEPPPHHAATECPGHPDAWVRRGERLGT